jgi:hypothetical protein
MFPPLIRTILSASMQSGHLFETKKVPFGNFTNPPV